MAKHDLRSVEATTIAPEFVVAPTVAALDDLSLQQKLSAFFLRPPSCIELPVLNGTVEMKGPEKRSEVFAAT
jgi:hypothetical protein